MVPSPAHIVLEAVRHATDVNLEALQNLIAKHASILQHELVLRILLTYLPESTEPSLYTGLLQGLLSGKLSALNDEGSICKSTEELSATDAARQVRKLHLLPLFTSQGYDADSIDPFTAFLLTRAHKIDTETGMLSLLQQLLEPFIGHSTLIRSWVISILLPLLRFDYEYYPNHVPASSLQDFEALEGRAAIDLLLSRASQQVDQRDGINFGRDLRGLVGPWMYGRSKWKRRKLSEACVKDSSAQSAGGNSGDNRGTTNWKDVYDWLLDLSFGDFTQAVSAVEQWDGPGDVDYGGWDEPSPNLAANHEEATFAFAQAGLAVIYSTQNASLQSIEGSCSIVRRISKLLDLPPPPTLQLETVDSSHSQQFSNFIDSVSVGYLFHDQLLLKSNRLTRPSIESLKLASFCLMSARVLESFGNSRPTQDTLSVALFGSDMDQRDLLRKSVYAFREGRKDSKVDGVWADFRRKLLWLANWGFPNKILAGEPDKGCYGLFCRLNSIEVEVDILRAFLMEGRYKLAADTYCAPSVGPIPPDRVEKLVLEVSFSFYDNASNGNKTRGGVKKASDISTLFQPYFPKSLALQQLNALLLATHSLSFYSLTLQRGVPLQPVNIRINPDASSLIDRLLKQNPRSYTKLDDLLDIGRNLLKAGLVKPGPELSQSPLTTDTRGNRVVEWRVIAKTIEAALAESDFDTAYSYVVNRLTPSELTQQNESAQSNASHNAEDDITWQAAYNAGRSQIPAASCSSELRRLEQKMELLSQALLLAPATSLVEVLATWRECEQEMNKKLARESEEENKWDVGEDRTLPGGFSIEDFDRVPQKPREPTRNAMNEEAPMGLFDISRGAANAFRKSAFPLRTPGLTNARHRGTASSAHGLPESPADSEGSIHDSRSSVDGEGRVRKRDMVSNMVTGGLASGIGWVLGAPPVRHE